MKFNFKSWQSQRSELKTIIIEVYLYFLNVINVSFFTITCSTHLLHHAHAAVSVYETISIKIVKIFPPEKYIILLEYLGNVAQASPKLNNIFINIFFF